MGALHVQALEVPCRDPAVASAALAKVPEMTDARSRDVAGPEPKNKQVQPGNRYETASAKYGSVSTGGIYGS